MTNTVEPNVFSKAQLLYPGEEPVSINNVTPLIKEIIRNNSAILIEGGLPYNRTDALSDIKQALTEEGIKTFLIEFNSDRPLAKSLQQDNSKILETLKLISKEIFDRYSYLKAYLVKNSENTQTNKKNTSDMFEPIVVLVENISVPISSMEVMSHINFILSIGRVVNITLVATLGETATYSYVYPHTRNSMQASVLLKETR